MLSYTWIGCAYNHLFLYLQDCYNAPTFSPLSPFIQEASFNKWYLEPLVFRTCEDVWLVIEGASSVLIWMSTHTSSRPNSRSSLLWHTSSKKSVFNFGTCPFVTISFFFGILAFFIGETAERQEKWVERGVWHATKVCMLQFVWYAS